MNEYQKVYNNNKHKPVKVKYSATYNLAEFQNEWILCIPTYSGCILFKYNQQDATLYNILYYCQCSTCFRLFLRPSSGAQKLYTQYLVCVKLDCCYR